MVLEISECIPIVNKKRCYTDCMEFSLLRFTQLLLYDIKEINSGYSYYPKNIKNNELREFFEKYPKIYQSMEFYDNTNERQDWSIFVSDRDFFDYYRNDNAELFTNIRNILLYFNNFFKLDLDLNKEQESLQTIANKFSSKNKKIEIEIKHKLEKHQEMKMKDIMLLLSRPDDEYLNFINKKYIIIEKKTILGIKINNISYDWNLIEIYFANKCFKNNFITGHSIIKKNEN